MARITNAPRRRFARFLPLALALTMASNANVSTGRAAEPPAAEAGAGFEVDVSKGSFESQGKSITFERFAPKAPGKYPAVLVLHGAGGMTVGGPWFRDAARRLAKHGYVALVVHYFDLTGTKIADQSAMKTNFEPWVRVVSDGISHALTQPDVDPARVGLIGFSLGSYLSLSEAVFDPRVLAVVDYFGGLPEVLAKKVKTLPPTLILHGDADPIVPVAEAKALETLCVEKKVTHEVCIYKGQGHGFTGESGIDAARRALAFLDKHVKTGDTSSKREAAAAPRPEAFAGREEGQGGE